MQEGLEYAIKILEGRAARHKKQLAGDFTNASKYTELSHHFQMEACLSAATSLRRKLRSVIKESQLQTHNSQSGEMPAILRAVKETRGEESPPNMVMFA